MRVKGFELDETLPELRAPHAIVSLRPWLEMGRVGRQVLVRLEKHLKGHEFGRLAQPGNFYDFTRYRPRVNKVKGERQMTIPNTTLAFAKGEGPHDFLFFHLLEPHALGEDFVESVLEILKLFDVKRYAQVGGVSDAVPHTRPLLVNGVVPDGYTERLRVQQSNYQGPTSIAYQITQEASTLGIETMSFLVHLPHYTQLDEDHSGVARLMEVLSELYDIPARLINAGSGKRQYQQIDAVMSRNPQARNMIQQLEASYDARVRASKEGERQILAPEVEHFLEEMEKRLGSEDP